MDSRIEEIELERLISHLEADREELPAMAQAALEQLKVMRESLGGYLA